MPLSRIVSSYFVCSLCRRFSIRRRNSQRKYPSAPPHRRVCTGQSEIYWRHQVVSSFILCRPPPQQVVMSGCPLWGWKKIIGYHHGQPAAHDLALVREWWPIIVCGETPFAFAYKAFYNVSFFTISNGVKEASNRHLEDRHWCREGYYFNVARKACHEKVFAEVD